MQEHKNTRRINMEIVTRRVKSLLKRLDEQNPEKFDVFIHGVLVAFLTQNLSSEQVKVSTALLQKEGYLA